MNKVFKEVVISVGITLGFCVGIFGSIELLGMLPRELAYTIMGTTIVGGWASMVYDYRKSQSHLKGISKDLENLSDSLKNR